MNYVKLTLNQNGYLLQYITIQTVKLCKMAVIQNPFAVSICKRNWMDELCALDVSHNDGDKFVFEIIT